MGEGGGGGEAKGSKAAASSLFKQDFPPDSNSSVIQFHFPLDAKGLKASGRFPWSHLSTLIERPEGQIIQIYSESNTLILENKKICGFRRQTMDQ